MVYNITLWSNLIHVADLNLIERKKLCRCCYMSKKTMREQVWNWR